MLHTSKLCVAFPEAAVIPWKSPWADGKCPHLQQIWSQDLQLNKILYKLFRKILKLISHLHLFQFYKRSVRKEYEQHWDEEVNSFKLFGQKQNTFKDCLKIIWTAKFFSGSLQNYLDIKILFRTASKLFGQQNTFQDPERVEQIMERAVMDADWVVKKYAKKQWNLSLKSWRGRGGRCWGCTRASWGWGRGGRQPIL